jgi:microcystin-dependent protein
MSEPYIGEIKIVGFNFAPRGFSTCSGQLLAISSNTALFSLLGTTFGGDGRTTFGLPDFRGRTAIGVGTGPGLTPASWGQRLGTEYTYIQVSNMPAHSHAIGQQTTVPAGTVVSAGLSGTASGPISASGDAGTATGPGNKYLANTAASGTEMIYTPTQGSVKTMKSTATVDLSTGSASVVFPAISPTLGNTQNTGGSQPIYNWQPSLAVYHIIAMIGIYPSRN